MSKQTKLLNHLVKGGEITARQITGSFGLKNPHEAIRQLRSQGHCIYSNRKTMADGTVATKYRIGSPSKRMVALANLVAGSTVFSSVQ
jgi:predicted transcriptional regulator